MENINNKDVYLEKVKQIQRRFKKDELIYDSLFINYQNMSIYVGLFFIKKLKCYKLIWIDLDDYNNRYFNRYINVVRVSNYYVNLLLSFLSTYDGLTEISDVTSDDKIFSFYCYKKTGDNKNINIAVNRFLPREAFKLCDLILSMGEYLPHNLYSLFDELLARINNKVNNQDYLEDYEIDIMNCNLDDVYGSKISKDGESFYSKDKIKYLEKIGDEYYAYIDDNDEVYTVIITPDEKRGTTQIYCSCPGEYLCKHSNAVIRAIRDKKWNRFAKIVYMNPNVPAIERIEDFNYFLCVDVVDDKFVVINHEGKIDEIEIYDPGRVCNWKIISDTKDKMLKNKLNI